MDSLPTPPPGYKTQSTDTAYWAEKLMFDHWRTLGPEESAREVSALCRAVFAAAERATRERWAGATDEQIELRIAELYLEPALAARACQASDRKGKNSAG